ncbi:MAG: hypothetical protein WKF79_13055 [Nocardioides sp.]
MHTLEPNQAARSTLTDRSLDSFDAHGSSLALIGALLFEGPADHDDHGDDRAAQLVAQVLVATASARPADADPPTRQDLAMGLYRRGRDLGCRHGPADPDVTLALCVHGGLSYRQVADLTSQPASTVAAHLVTALRSVRDGDPTG